MLAIITRSLSRDGARREACSPVTQAAPRSERVLETKLRKSMA